ncbi:TetR/AcrR family transcriptional regulator [Micromonospora sp. NPDC093244]|uniref:TetR/AcrR family transcriptional regulator n=1 Tax=Micromonospora sp. NPDC093244 TaxID=3155071 RepID=UPI00343C1E85
MRTPEQNQALSAATRESIELAAVRAFARHGYAASSIRQIAEEASLSIGSIYRHHASKEALFEALLERALTGLAAAVGGLSRDGDPLALARGFTRAFLTDLASDHGPAEFYRVINQGFLTDTPPGTAARLAVGQQALWNAFADLVRRGQASGQFAAGDPVQLTAYYFAMLSGIATMRLVNEKTPIDSGVDIALRLLSAEGRP